MRSGARGLEFHPGLRTGGSAVSLGHGSCSAVPSGGGQPSWQAPRVYIMDVMPTLRVRTWQIFFPK